MFAWSEIAGWLTLNDNPKKYYGDFKFLLSLKISYGNFPRVLLYMSYVTLLPIASSGIPIAGSVSWTSGQNMTALDGLFASIRLTNQTANGVQSIFNTDLLPTGTITSVGFETKYALQATSTSGVGLMDITKFRNLSVYTAASGSPTSLREVTSFIPDLSSYSPSSSPLSFVTVTGTIVLSSHTNSSIPVDIPNNNFSIVLGVIDAGTITDDITYYFDYMKLIVNYQDSIPYYLTSSVSRCGAFTIKR